MKSLEFTISDELMEAIVAAKDSYNARKLTRLTRNLWVEAMLADAARQELGARAEAEAENP